VTLDGGAAAARTPRADARRNRQRVLDAAESAFAADGISVPIDEIARRAGVGAGTVYRHFPTKEALFHAIVLTRLERMAGQARVLAGAPDPGAAFFDFLAMQVDEGRAKRDLVDALAAAGFDSSPAGTQVGREFRGAVAELLASAQRAGAVRDDVGIADLMALLRGISLAVRDAEDPDQARRLLEIVCSGLRPPAISPPTGAGRGTRASAR
jgi:AcrR family transcriptional regulator